ncbi:hypothetical protein [Morganella psychrotolerans]|nr:hypothetical protein [Morganella psychrotolerans]
MNWNRHHSFTTLAISFQRRTEHATINQHFQQLFLNPTTLITKDG